MTPGYLGDLRSVKSERSFKRSWPIGGSLIVVEFDHVHTICLDLLEVGGRRMSVTQATNPKVPSFINAPKQRPSSEAVPSKVQLEVDGIVEDKGEGPRDFTDGICHSLDCIGAIIVRAVVPRNSLQQVIKDNLCIILLRDGLAINLPGISVPGKYRAGSAGVRKWLPDNLISSHCEDRTRKR